MKFLLILIVTYTGTNTMGASIEVESIEFDDKAACEAALVEVKKLRREVKGVCVARQSAPAAKKVDQK